MPPEIIEAYSPCGVNAGKIVRRIVRFIEPGVFEGLNAIWLMDSHPQAFGAYKPTDAEIHLFVEDIVGWQPWLLKKTYIFPYLSIGLILGHELDHHVNRHNKDYCERDAELNSMKYIYPSMGIFKPVVKLLNILAMAVRRMDKSTGEG
jgi:hypothetical protein